MSRLAALINDRNLIAPKTFNSRVAELLEQRALIDREARFLNNAARLLEARHRGIVLARDPADFLGRCEAADPGLAASALRVVRRSLGAAAAEQAAAAAKQQGETREGLERKTAMADYADKIARLAPTSEDRARLAPDEQKTEILERARELTARAAGIPAPERTAAVIAKSPPRQRFRRLSGERDRVL